MEITCEGFSKDDVSHAEAFQFANHGWTPSVLQAPEEFPLMHDIANYLREHEARIAMLLEKPDP